MSMRNTQTDSPSGTLRRKERKGRRATIKQRERTSGETSGENGREEYIRSADDDERAELGVGLAFIILKTDRKNKQHTRWNKTTQTESETDIVSILFAPSFSFLTR
jgi:hypothetical protein